MISISWWESRIRKYLTEVTDYCQRERGWRQVVWIKLPADTRTAGLGLHDTSRSSISTCPLVGSKRSGIYACVDQLQEHKSQSESKQPCGTQAPWGMEWGVGPWVWLRPLAPRLIVHLSETRGRKCSQTVKGSVKFRCKECTKYLLSPIFLPSVLVWFWSLTLSLNFLKYLRL